MTTEITRTGRSLPQLEAIIERGKAAFLEVGAALLEIRDRQLYEEAGYATFEDYVRERHGITRQRAYQLMDAVLVVEVVSTTVDTDAIPNEAVARELAPIAKTDPEAAREVWVEVQQSEKPVTAKVVKVQVTRRRERARYEMVQEPDGTMRMAVVTPVADDEEDAASPDADDAMLELPEDEDPEEYVPSATLSGRDWAGEWERSQDAYQALHSHVTALLQVEPSTVLLAGASTKVRDIRLLLKELRAWIKAFEFELKFVHVEDDLPAA